MRSDEIAIYLNEQLRHEFLRNREKVLADSLKTMRGLKLPTAFPQLMRNYNLFKELDTARKQYEQHLADLSEKAREDASEGNLHADTLIEELFGLAAELEVTKDIVAAAKARSDRGNPPGKAGSYGDALTWELLLARHPEGEDLDLVTADADYVSLIRENRVHEFLEEEWRATQSSVLALHPNLTHFFRQHYPDIKLSTELEREVAVSRLVSSGSFASTHAAITRLSKHSEFTSGQAQALVEGALRNSQIRLILSDFDVRDFLERLITDYADVVDPDDVALLETLMAGE